MINTEGKIEKIHSEREREREREREATFSPLTATYILDVPPLQSCAHGVMGRRINPSW